VSAYLSKKRRKGKDGESQDVTPAESTPEGKDA
jgi:hypothetical protein